MDLFAHKAKLVLIVLQELLVPLVLEKADGVGTFLSLIAVGFSSCLAFLPFFAIFVGGLESSSSDSEKAPDLRTLPPLRFRRRLHDCDVGIQGK